MTDRFEITTSGELFEFTDHGFMLACEAHPDRKLGTSAMVRKGVVHDPGGVWDIYVTDDGWTIGDMKVLIAICPECAAAYYRMPKPAAVSVADDAEETDDDGEPRDSHGRDYDDGGFSAIDRENIINAGRGHLL